ncbi:MAG: sulfotransferase [Anaerolineae bacterium]|jgi:LPS sulfotransferase NodH|nr:sulfotransferase [Anaerolineae bacterium]
MLPRNSYFICTTARSGSTLLCQLLTDTGVAGEPGEYFYHRLNRSYLNLDITDYDAYLRRVIGDKVGANGVFGVKIMGGDLRFFIEKICETVPQTALQEALARYFPRLRHVWLTRRNKVRQAVSFYKAIKTWEWRSSDQKSKVDLTYDFEYIDRLVQEIVLREAIWQEYFTECGIVPLSLTYEDYVEDQEGTVRAVLEYIGITPPAALTIMPVLKKQADALSEEWVQRYRHDKQVGWSPPSW